MSKWISWFGIGFGSLIVGVVIGATANRKKMLENIEEITEVIYQEAYTQARKDIFNEVLEKEAQDQKDQNTYRRKVEMYDKPNLTLLHYQKTNESLDPEPEEDIPADEVVEPFESAKATHNPMPYIISEQEFEEEYLDNGKNTIYFYALDGIFTDDEDQIFDAREFFKDLVPDIISQLKINTSNVYVRNDMLRNDFEIQYMMANYADIAFETNNERGRRIAKRKMRSHE